MKKISVMVVVALMSASMFAGSANLPAKTKTVNGTAVNAATHKTHNKQKTKDNGADKEKKTHKKHSKKEGTNQTKAQK